jgi:hypothetical protein
MRSGAAFMAAGKQLKATRASYAGSKSGLGWWDVSSKQLEGFRRRGKRPNVLHCSILGKGLQELWLSTARQMTVGRAREKWAGGICTKAPRNGLKEKLNRHWVLYAFLSHGCGTSGRVGRVSV